MGVGKEQLRAMKICRRLVSLHRLQLAPVIGLIIFLSAAKITRDLSPLGEFASQS